jgi:hypothetical protein
MDYDNDMNANARAKMFFIMLETLLGSVLGIDE